MVLFSLVFPGLQWSRSASLITPYFATSTPCISPVGHLGFLLGWQGRPGGHSGSSFLNLFFKSIYGSRPKPTKLGHKYRLQWGGVCMAGTARGYLPLGTASLRHE